MVDEKTCSDELDLRERAAQTARDLFILYGYHGTTMRMLADALGVSVTALYYHYRSKEDIRARVIQLDLEEALNQVREVVECQTAPLPALEGAIRVQIRHSLGIQGGGSASYWGVAGDSVELDATSLASRAEYERIFCDLLRRCVEEHTAAVGDPNLAGRAILQLTEGIAAWFQLGDQLTAYEVEEQYLDLIWGMIRAATPPTTWARRRRPVLL